MITQLLRKAYRLDVELWIEDTKLRYRSPRPLEETFIQALKENKSGVIDRLIQNEAATTALWGVFDHGELYGRCISHHADIYICRDEESLFTVWRGSWAAGESKPYSEKVIVERVYFETAIERANNYVKWFISKNKTAFQQAG